MTENFLTFEVKMHIVSVFFSLNLFMLIYCPCVLYIDGIDNLGTVKFHTSTKFSVQQFVVVIAFEKSKLVLFYL